MSSDIKTSYANRKWRDAQISSGHMLSILYWWAILQSPSDRELSDLGLPPACDEQVKLKRCMLVPCVSVIVHRSVSSTSVIASE